MASGAKLGWSTPSRFQAWARPQPAPGNGKHNAAKAAAFIARQMKKRKRK